MAGGAAPFSVLPRSLLWRLVCLVDWVAYGVARASEFAYNAWLHRKFIAIVDGSGLSWENLGGVTPSAVRGRLLGQCGDIVWDWC